VPSHIHAARCVASVALLASVATTPAHAEVAAIAEAMVAAFKETCLSEQHSSLDGLRSAALADGWTHQSVRVVSTATGSRLDGAAGPKFLRKGDFTLSLAPDPVSGAHVCAISASFDVPLTTKLLAQTVSDALNVGEPTLLPDGRSERALWRLEGRVHVEATVKRKSSLLDARLVARPAEPQFARRH
jgi:hypothetical protein